MTTGPSEKTRRDVMERDQGVCQFFCGGQPATEISHFQHQGPSGLPPDHWKNQPPNLAASCSECHRRFPPNGNWRWVEFEPAKQGAPGAGIPEHIGTMKILDPGGNKVPEHTLWFYNRWKKLAAIMAAQSLQTVGEIDSSVGEMMRDLRDGVRFLAGARSFDEHISGLGWDPIKANDIADVYEWAIEREGWPSEVNYAKMRLIYDAIGPSPGDAEFIQTAASGASYSTLKKDLIKAGLLEARWGTFLVCSPVVLKPDLAVDGVRLIPEFNMPVFVRTRREDELIQAATERGLAVMKVNAFKGRLQFKRGKEGGLFDKATGEAIPLRSFEEWRG